MPASQTTANPFSQSCTTSFFPLSLILWLAIFFFFEVEKQVEIPWYKVGAVWGVLENFPLELFSRPLSSTSCRLILQFFE
jgi:hypothetical protein